MSATFRLNTKKKITQNELRRLMAEQKGKISKEIPKINNPLAKYNDAGQLICVLCNSVVRSESVWQVHVNTKQHRNNIEEAKRLKELTNNFTNPVKVKKRCSSPPQPIHQEKKLKGILKNASSNNMYHEIPITQSQSPKNALNILHHDEEIKRPPTSVSVVQKLDAPGPSDADNTIKDGDLNQQTASDKPLPEGFFDDPVLDAKARNIEYKNPIEEEWEKFQKEIREEASASAEIIAEEQEEATAERQIDEIDEQMRNWSRVLELELKKEEAQKIKNENYSMEEGEDNETDNEVDIDEFLDWRAKKAYR